MKIGVAGSVARDHLMTYPGRFADSLVDGALDRVSLSFLVDSLEIRRGGCAANIAFGLGVLGLNPILIAAVGHDWGDYDAWLRRHGVDTSHVLVVEDLHTATFIVNTDESLNQIASFFTGAMSRAREIELEPIQDAVGGLDLLVISPDDPEAMLRHSEAARGLGIPFVSDPSQQLARMSGEEIANLIIGAKYLFLNEYELELALQKTGWSDAQLFEHVEIRVITMGAAGARIEEHGRETISVPVPEEKAKVDPTGIGDSFRAGFIAGLSRGLSHRRCAEIGSLVATYCLETKGTQEYRVHDGAFLERFTEAYGSLAAEEIAPLLRK